MMNFRVLEYYKADITKKAAQHIDEQPVMINYKYLFVEKFEDRIARIALRIKISHFYF